MRTYRHGCFINIDDTTLNTKHCTKSYLAVGTHSSKFPRQNQIACVN